MKKNRIYFGLIASGLLLSGLTQSCVSEEDFSVRQEGEGRLSMKFVLNSKLTRAEAESENVADNLTIFLSRANGNSNDGLLYKFDNAADASEPITLRTGKYVAEAWAGDSVTASFDSKFYRGFKRFEIESGVENKVVVTCKIANVAVSIDETTVDPDIMKDWTITVSNSRGSLAFNEENMEYAIAYFMMPNSDIAVDENGKMLQDEEEWPLYTNLNYKIEGKTAEGKPFVKEGPIYSNNDAYRQYGNIVEHAHNYRLKLKYDPKYEETGGSFITIVVEDIDENDKQTQEVGLYSRPSISGVGFDVERAVSGSEAGFETPTLIKVAAFKSLAKVILSVSESDRAAFSWPTQSIDLMNVIEDNVPAINQLGISWDFKSRDVDGVDLCSSYITFDNELLLNKLTQRDNEPYIIHIEVTDGFGKVNSADLKIAVGEYEEDPVKAVEMKPENDYMAILAKSASIPVQIIDDSVECGIEYRVKGAGNWTFVKAVVPTRASNDIAYVNLTDLTPGTDYEYRAATADFQSKDVMTFTTEAPFILPDTDMETWSQYNKAWFPGSDYTKNFWDSGNHGGANFNVVLTEGSTDMAHSGSKSAKLRSQFAGLGSIGKFAAGNLFVGKFGSTNGTKGARLTFGQPYNGSHPSALSVYVNYKPATISHVRASGTPVLKNGDMDQGQIFVAFATQAQNLDTSEGIYFEPDPAKNPTILGYGEADWAPGESYGENNGLKELVIPIKWYEGARSNKATHIIIVCSASKYGDFFEGGAGSLMYVDDFELVY